MKPMVSITLMIISCKHQVKGKELNLLCQFWALNNIVFRTQAEWTDLSWCSVFQMSWRKTQIHWLVWENYGKLICGNVLSSDLLSFSSLLNRFCCEEVAPQLMGSGVGSEDCFSELILSFLSVDVTQVIRFYSKHLYPLSPLADSEFLLLQLHQTWERYEVLHWRFLSRYWCEKPLSSQFASRFKLLNPFCKCSLRIAVTRDRVLLSQPPKPK